MRVVSPRGKAKSVRRDREREVSQRGRGVKCHREVGGVKCHREVGGVKCL